MTKRYRGKYDVTEVSDQNFQGDREAPPALVHPITKCWQDGHLWEDTKHEGVKVCRHCSYEGLAARDGSIKAFKRGA